MESLYSYDGPVMLFDRCITNHWKAITYAINEKKAKSNLKYQYKKMHNLSRNAKIELPGNLETPK